MAKVPLTRDQEKSRREISRIMREARKLLEGRETSGEYAALVTQASTLAHELHVSLTESGYAPRHRRHMLKNRECPPGAPEFYQHTHAIEDLLKFVGNSDANDDPIDTTIESDFTLRVFSCRWGHDDSYRLRRTADGWHIRHIDGGDCDKEGQPHLYRWLRHDDIEFPDSLPSWMSALWQKAFDSGLSQERVQKALDALGEWISSTEVNAPFRGAWSGYKRRAVPRPRRPRIDGSTPAS